VRIHIERDADTRVPERLRDDSTKQFQHADDGRIVKADPNVEIPWSYLGEGLWKAECVCTAEYFREPLTDDRVRNDPLEIGHRCA
jgi:hypothetical protein